MILYRITDTDKGRELETIAERLRECMRRVGDSTVRAIQKRSGVPYATAHGIYNGVVEMPERATVEKLAAAYNVTAEWLISGETAAGDRVEALIAAMEHPAIGLMDQAASPAARVAAAFTYAKTREFTEEEIERVARWANARLSAASAK